MCGTESVVVIEEDKKNSGLVRKAHLPYAEQKFYLGGESIPDTLYIRFGSRSELNNQIKYGPFLLEDGSQSPVYLSYNTIQLFADSVTRGPENVFTAKGNVILEDGKSSRTFEEVTFRPKNGTYTVTYSKPILDN
jgi:hypothetical protein